MEMDWTKAKRGWVLGRNAWLVVRVWQSRWSSQELQTASKRNSLVMNSGPPLWMLQYQARKGSKHTMETKETSTGGERVTVCWMVTGSGVGGVCTKDVKTMDMEGTAVVKRDG